MSMPRLTSLLADWAALDAQDGPVDARALADALLQACGALPYEMLGRLPATPDDAAAALARTPFADRLEGAYLPIEWLESYCAALGLPLAEIDSGWDISDGDDVYFCPRILLADDPDSPQDTRPFVRVDQIQRWPEPQPTRPRRDGH
jgi:hypothetical protein